MTTKFLCSDLAQGDVCEAIIEGKFDLDLLDFSITVRMASWRLASTFQPLLDHDNAKAAREPSIQTAEAADSLASAGLNTVESV